MTKATNYLTLNYKYLREADALLEKGDYVQASEKLWGAAAAKVKSVAAQRGVRIRSHEGLNRFIAKLGDELNDPELPRLLAIAAYLHQNFYEDWLPPEMVMNYSEAVKELVSKLDGIR
jgi:hypothetical protein